MDILRDDIAEWLAARRMPLWLRFLDALRRSAPFVVQSALALNALLFALILDDPAPTFETARGYDWMARLGTEHGWALISFAFALAGFSGVIASNIHVQRFAALASSVFTGVIGWGFWVSNSSGTGHATYGVLTALSYWLLIYRVFVRG